MILLYIKSNFSKFSDQQKKREKRLQFCMSHRHLPESHYGVDISWIFNKILVFGFQNLKN